MIKPSNAVKKIKENPESNYNKTCPATMIEKRRIAKLKGRENTESISMGTNKKAKDNGAPAGKNKVKKFNNCDLRACSIRNYGYDQINVNHSAI